MWCLASMLAVFGVWALFGFGYPSAPATTTLNVVSKILALLAALTLFVPAAGRARHRNSSTTSTSKGKRRRWTGVM